MKSNKTTAVLLLIAAAAAYYFLIYKKGTEKKVVVSAADPVEEPKVSPAPITAEPISTLRPPPQANFQNIIVGGKSVLVNVQIVDGEMIATAPNGIEYRYDKKRNIWYKHNPYTLVFDPGNTVISVNMQQ